tara:strand:- start:1019 stop:1255 length:237 start_codon:yes stop_codon:yes gene_type:complete
MNARKNLIPKGPRYAEVEGSTLIRDKHNNAILETDQMKINKARIEKARRKAELEEMQHLKGEVAELKDMMKVLIEKIN